jgi:hypothetical protein
VNRTEFQELMHEQFGRLLDINNKKGADYAGNEDALSNFKRHAVELGLTPEQIWAVYASKHWDSIITYCREGAVASEPIEGRIDDALLYLFLLRGLVAERQEGNVFARDAATREMVVTRGTGETRD